MVVLRRLSSAMEPWKFAAVNQTDFRWRMGIPPERFFQLSHSGLSASLLGSKPPGFLLLDWPVPLQFDRDSEGSFQEKRTSLSGVHIRFKLAIERHASKIYTRSMFQRFEETLYKANAYVLDVVFPKKEYIATHVDASARETWIKVQYTVEVAEDESFFSCECGIFKHSGMVCCHSLKVAYDMLGDD